MTTNEKPRQGRNPFYKPSISTNTREPSVGTAGGTPLKDPSKFKKGFNAFGKGFKKTASVAGKGLAGAYETSSRAKTVYHEKRILSLKRRQEVSEYKANLLNLKSQRASHKLNITGSKVAQRQQKTLLRDEQRPSVARVFRENTRKSKPGPLSDYGIKRRGTNPITGKKRHRGGFFD